MDKYGEGVKGEVSAKNFLIEKGFVIIAENVNYKDVGELDIVAKDGQTLVFVEVRTRNTRNFGHPFETVTKSKIRRIVKASAKFISENNVLCANYRYDVIGITFGTIEYIQDAFFAKW